MAQGDLKKLLENIESNLVRQMTRDDKSSKRFREVLERRPHDLTIDRESLAREIMLQIKDLTKSAVAPRTDKGNLAQSFRREFGSGYCFSSKHVKHMNYMEVLVIPHLLVKIVTDLHLLFKYRLDKL